MRTARGRACPRPQCQDAQQAAGAPLIAYWLASATRLAASAETKSLLNALIPVLKDDGEYRETSIYPPIKHRTTCARSDVLRRFIRDGIASM